MVDRYIEEVPEQGSILFGVDDADSPNDTDIHQVLCQMKEEQYLKKKFSKKMTVINQIFAGKTVALQNKIEL